MSQKKERVHKLEASLTPQQAVLVWMEEAHRLFPNMRELARSLKGQPSSEFPLSRLQNQVVDAVVAATKGQPRPAVAQALRQPLRDMYFLYHLHVNANVWIRMEVEAATWRRVALSERLQAMRVEDAFRTIIGHAAMMVSMDMPYPVDPATAAAVEAAITHHVSTWDQLNEDGTIATWVFDHLVQQGATEIPGDAYRYEGEKCIPTLGPHNEDTVRACFKDDTHFERFRAGEDYTNGLADITDAEFNAHYDSVVSGMRDLVRLGQVQAGTAIVLETVLIPFLKESPLVEGQWLDHHVAELAELGELRKENGYGAVEDEDDHPLASARIVGDDNQEAGMDMITTLAKTAADNLGKFKGRAREIDGRPYVQFEDYRACQRLRAKEALSPTLCDGLVTSSWNAWVECQGGGGTATLAGVLVELLPSGVDRHHYQVCSTGAEAMLDSRRQLLGLMRRCQSDQDRDAEDRADWQAAAKNFLTELYSLREGLGLVSRKYFAGQSVLFSDAARHLDQFTTAAEELVSRFNSEFGKEAGDLVDVEAIRLASSKGGSQVAATIVDTAKAEAMIEVGEQDGAAVLMERHV